MARQGIFLDPVNAGDFLKLNLIYCCEQCSHFNPTEKACTIGYNAKNHIREQQLKTFDSSGRMAICRMLEID